METEDVIKLINIMKPHLEPKRRRVKIDMDELLSLKMMGMSDEDCAKYFQVSSSTIYRRVRELIKEGRL